MTSIAEIITRAANVWNSTPAAIYGTSRRQHHMRARRLAMYLARELTDLSYGSIGDLFSNDAGTIRHACRTMERTLDGDGSHVEAAVCRAVREEFLSSSTP
jgi:chromosomal replication initiation ATPase DnaA